MRTRFLMLVCGGCLLFASFSSAQTVTPVVHGHDGLITWTDNWALATLSAYPVAFVFDISSPDTMEIRFEGGDPLPSLTLGRLRAFAANEAVMQGPPLIVIDLGGPALMITPAIEQMVALQQALDVFNVSTRRDETPWTLNEWIRSWILDRARQHVAEHRDREKTSACETFLKLSAADWKVIMDKLGGSPCVSP